MKVLGVPPSRLVKVVKRTIEGYEKDDFPALAGAVTYFAVFSIFPMLLIMVALAGLFMTPTAAAELIFQRMGDITPDPTIQKFLADTFAKILSERDPLNGIAGAIGFAGLLFGASGVFGILDKAINRAWGCEFAPSLIRDRLIAFAMVAGVIVALIASLVLTSLLTFIQNRAEPLTDPLPGDKWMWYFVNLGASLLLYALVLMVIYRTLPRCKVSWGEVWPGAVLASLLLEVLKQAFAFYLGTFANYGNIYGPLGTLVALMTWIWLSTQVMLLGAEFASQFSREFQMLEAVRASANNQETLAGRVREDRLRRRRRRRVEEEGERRRTAERSGRTEAEFAPPVSSARVVAAAAAGAAVAGLLARVATLLLRR